MGTKQEFPFSLFPLSFARKTPIKPHGGAQLTAFFPPFFYFFFPSSFFFQTRIRATTDQTARQAAWAARSPFFFSCFSSFSFTFFPGLSTSSRDRSKAEVVRLIPFFFLLILLFFFRRYQANREREGISPLSPPFFFLSPLTARSKKDASLPPLFPTHSYLL